MASKKNTGKTITPRQKNLLKFRFMVTSKFIGIVAFFFIFVITIYAMYEMHISRDYSSLPQLIISAFGFGSVYAGFYLVMAKVEHVEEEKTYRETQLHNLKEKNAPQEEIQAQQQRIADLEQQVSNLLQQGNGPII